MRAASQAIGLPLLTKELLEQAARRRTYVVRSVYALLLFFFSVLIFWGEVYDEATSPFELLGKGREMYSILLALQFAGILLFTPALTCGAITSEKERNTFGLLMLTKLGPWTILLEKYLGRLVTMGTYLLLSVPLLGFCYALGGLEQKDLWVGIAALAATIIQVAAIGMFCSAWFRTTVGAFIGTYVIGFLVLFGPPIADEMFRFQFMKSIADMHALAANVVALASLRMGVTVAGTLQELAGQNPVTWPLVQAGFKPLEIAPYGDAASFLFVAPVVAVFIDGPWSLRPAWHGLAYCVPAVGSGLFFLLLARVFIIRRAFVTPKYYLLRFFRGLDTVFQRLNQNRLTRGVVLVHDSQLLPMDEPVAWRETKKKALGTFRYLVRIFVALEFPVVFFCLLAIMLHSGSGYSYWDHHPAIVLITTIAWLAALLLVTVKGATLVSGERSSETLDVLLSTPISSEQFIREKFQGVVRLMLVVAFPLVTAIGMQAWFISIVHASRGPGSALEIWLPQHVSMLAAGYFTSLALLTYLALRTRTRLVGGRMLAGMWVASLLGALLLYLLNVDPQSHRQSSLSYLIGGLLSVAVYLPLAAWLSFYIGLRMKTQTRAIFTALTVLVAWCILPLVILGITFEVMDVQLRNSPIGLSLFVSPLAFPFFNEIGELDDVVPRDMLAFTIAFNFASYAGLARLIRRHVLTRAPLLLGRSHTQA